jgi:hypothetical protein
MSKYTLGNNPKSLANLRPNIPQIHDEPKTARINSTLTPTGKEGIIKLAKKYDLSLSELIELIGRGEFEITRKVG